MQNLKTDHNLSSSRPEISVYIATSIDGYIARKDGNLDWLQYRHIGDEDYGLVSSQSYPSGLVQLRYEVIKWLT